MEKNFRETVADIWKTLLNAEINDKTDFFEEGGNSLIIAIMLRKLEAETKVHIEPFEVYQHSNFSDFCSLAEERLQEN